MGNVNFGDSWRKEGRSLISMTRKEATAEEQEPDNTHAKPTQNKTRRFLNVA